MNAKRKRGKPAKRAAPAPPPGHPYVRNLLGWYAAVKRPFPWRGTADPYRIWISEIMLQQTQAERGVRHFTAWLRRFPDIRAVAEAAEADVLAAWEGLGYYSRARNIRLAAKRVMEEHGGEFPRAHEKILSLPGVGDYTAGSIASIAFGAPEPAVDANVLRVFARVLDICAPIAAAGAKRMVTEAVRALLPADAPGEFNQALMELGALVCGRSPKCGECPVRGDCAAFRNGTAADRPVKGAKSARTLRETVAGIVLDADGKACVRRRPPGGLWAGMWELPGGEIENGESPGEAVARHIAGALGTPAAVRGEIAVVRHGYTTNRAVLHGYLCELAEPAQTRRDDGAAWKWVAPGELASRPFPAGHRKLLERLGWK
ncbi:MAG: A/G-specific adenine glycosylase [Planctomycetota bacterium]|jgi:A/G-specific adenine glycosylase|nr:A/G-specific adenine glycosylase [Planctomycetota bacterium]